ncbi:MAG: hypothetical protein LQ340_005440 [Diploschistes diacapsis]|nr:MAG: hypothetical protein LQ340_005440 [Diploschistes diacapsis]
MGITGLLPLLKSIQKPCHLKKFQGLTLGVDAYGWLHRGTIACAIELALGKPTTKWVDFTMHRVRMLIHFGITPYLVFDGDYLPSKAATEDERQKRRTESRKLGLELHRLGKTSQAHLELQKAIDVTPEMARQLIEELKRHHIKYVVAPYEADAQLAYLERKGIIHGVLSEDSDLLVFGVKRLLTKLDQYGECVEISRKDFTACKDISLVGWTDAEFRMMAILSGCDYLPNINKMGLKTAYRLIRKHKTVEKILQMLSFDGTYRIPPGYLENFRRAELTFLHQRVYCPTRRQVVYLTPLDGPRPDDFDFVGKDIEATIAVRVAVGDLNPITKEQIIYYPTLCPAASPSPWALTKQKNTITPSDLKPRKPIGDFFKPKRVPLAELDPNSFTPSPSQQRVLHQQTGSVVSTPVVETPASLSFSARNNTDHVSTGSANITSVRSFSAQHPPKRQRLCAEEESDGSNNHSPNAKQSRFFGSTPLEPSPSLNPRSRRTRTTKINLWSDDSIENAMAELSETPHNIHEPPTKVAVLYESSNETGSTVTQETPSFQSETSTVATLVTDTSSVSKLETPPSSIACTEAENDCSSQVELFSQKSKKKLTSSFQTLAKRYSLSSTLEQHCPSKAQSLPNLIATNSLTRPVQRTVSRIPCPSTPHHNSISHTMPNKTVSYPQLFPTSKTDSPLNPISHNSQSSQEVVLQSPDALVRQSPLPQGSEDCLVPCSEVESEGEDTVEVEEDDIASRRLNLGRFAFVA